jgi:putative ABC transport system permease protein
MLWETIRLAIRAIRRNLLRSVLTVLGVVIGVAAVIAMVTVGQGSADRVASDVESLGSSSLLLFPGKDQRGPEAQETAPAFRLSDVEALSHLAVIASVAPVASSSATVVAGSENVSTILTGTTDGYLAATNRTVARGRSFTETEERAGAAVCILGETVRQALFGALDPLDQTIRIRAVSCRVIGLLDAKGASTFGQDQDDIVLMPIRTLQRRITGNQDVSSIRLALADGVSTQRGTREIEALMRQNRRIGPGDEDDFDVFDMREIGSILGGITAVLTGLLSSVAAVSLLVGGIGIMNIMLVSVTERTREIGIRLAVGAQARQVLQQFLVEAMVLSILGGILGILLGLALAAIASSFMDIPFAPDLRIVVLAFGFSALVGIAFGYFPARRAARLDPIEALRHQ